MKQDLILRCDICTADMVLEVRLKNVKGKRGNTFRRRRFKCTVCDYRKTIYADGQRDENADPYLALEAAKKVLIKQSKDESEHRDKYNKQ